MAQEQEFLKENGVLITNARVVTPTGDTYSLANVTSCKQRYTEHEGIDKKKKMIKNLILIGGIILGIIIAISANIIAGIIVAVIAVIASFFINPKFNYKIYKIYLGSASGEKEAIHSQDVGFIGRISDAVNRAIISRG